MNVLGVAFALSVGCVTASDVGSLMQVGVKGHESQSVSLAIANLQNEIANLPLSDAGDKLAINALMSTIEGGDYDDAGATAVFEQVRDLLNQVLSNLQGYRDAIQNTIDAINPAIDDCNVLMDQQEADHLAAYQADQTSHNTCRGQELALFQADANACGALTEYLEGVYQASGSATQSGGWCYASSGYDRNYHASEDWLAFLGAGQSAANLVKTQLQPLKDACLLATANLESKITECDNHQLNFETDFCIWRATYIQRCDAIGTCYNGEADAYNNNIAQWLATSDRRKLEAALVSRILCLVNNLIGGITDIDQCNNVPTDPAHYHPVYGNDGITLTAKTVCDPAINTYPDSADGQWPTLAGYTSLDARTPATSTGVHCITNPTR